MPEQQLHIAVDGMGGDHAPREVVPGVVAAVADPMLSVTLVGRSAELAPLLDEAMEAAGAGGAGGQRALRERIALKEASEVVGMSDHPGRGVRAHPDSSIVVACREVAEGRAAAVVSAGNSGAVLAAALLHIHRLPGVERPAIAVPLPVSGGTTILLDAGANTDCKPAWLYQFALMGNSYCRQVLSVAEPRVALLSNGEEPGKGSQLIQAATDILAQSHEIAFVGNIEGRQLLSGSCDVAVCDGFTGNIALKVAEGTGEFLLKSLRDELKGHAIATLGGALIRSRIMALRERIDYRNTGGALLLGVRGEVVIAHGRSDAVAIAAAIRLAAQSVRAKVSAGIEKSISGSAAGQVVAGRPLPATRQESLELQEEQR